MKERYRFLPFRFERFADRTLLVNDVGEYIFLDEVVFADFVGRKLETDSSAYRSLKSRNLAWDNHLARVIDLLATKYRTKKQFLYDFSTLHMFVLTRRCNQRCAYCHASSVDSQSGSVFDMDRTTARKCVDMALASPSQSIKIEFQGGEPLLSFPVLKEIVEYASERNETAGKQLEFVICSNLLALDQERLDYLKARGICVSTSLDGPQDVHDAFRKGRNGAGSHEVVSRHLAVVQDELGHDKVSALLTVTLKNINRLQEVIEEYLRQNLGSIFIRMLNPLGFAHSEWKTLGYTVEDFLSAYAGALEEIIRVNRSGIHFPETFATILLSRILTPFATGFVDLQSPAGVGIGGVIYDTNGDVYVSDEARMLSHATGDKRFCIGNVHRESWAEIFGSQKLREIIRLSCIEAIPGCAWCAFQPYCGGDPVRNYALHGDLVGKRPENDFCKKHKGLFRLLFDYLAREDDELEDVFWSWLTYRSLDKVRLRSFSQE
ncbi:MAG: His-Xaa-Ser system radical SAM maturase HxsB [Syntrophobacteraceae bacterium]